MPVTQGDLSLRKSLVVNDVAAQNGGRLSDNLVTASLFPDVNGIDRGTGIQRFRKIFFKNEAGVGTPPNKYTDAALSLIAGKMFLENISASGDRFLIKAGTASDVQSGVVDSGWSGVGYLEANVSAGATSLQVRCEVDGSAGEIFQCTSATAANRVVLISNYVAGVGVREFITLNQSTDTPAGVVWGAGADANLATLNFTATPLQNAYKRSALNTAGNGERTATSVGVDSITCDTDNMSVNALVGKRVRIKSASTGAGQIRRVYSNTVQTIVCEYAWTTLPTGVVVYEVLDTYGSMTVPLGDITSSFGTFSATCSNGRTGQYTATGNAKSFPIGMKDDSWTLTFAGPSTFTVAGLATGSVTAGGPFSTASPCRPGSGNNLFFELGVAGWSGTWDIGDTLTFTTTSPSRSVWVKEVVPAGMDSHLANSVDIGASGDTV